MEKLTREDGSSPDLVADTIEKLKEIVPEAFADGRIDFEVLKQTLGEYVDDQDERYFFTWHGKSRARQIAQMPSSGTLLPCPDESVNWDTTKNIFIEGDNLEVLKLLQKSYHRKVKMIYIDPPYNTGKEFIYPDKWQDNLDTYLRYTRQVDDEGFKLAANTETSGRYHTNWLNMMYPRLKLARNLLRDDGVIFVSIDDNEVHNLRHLMDEIFGSENFVAQMIWEGAFKNDARQIGVNHEYILVYSRSRDSQLRSWRIKKEGVAPVLAEVDRLQREHGSDFREASSALAAWFRANKATPSFGLRRFHFIDKRGAYKEDDPTAPGGRRFRLINPSTRSEIPLRENRGWTFDQERFEELVLEGRISFVTETSIMVRRYLHETDYVTPQSVFYQPARSASERLRRLMGGDVFSFPKDETVLSTLVEMCTGDDGSGDVVLDFFAGSGTTSHAVWAQNAEDEGGRRWILVQLPEMLDPSNNSQRTASDYCSAMHMPRTLTALAKERIRRAGAHLDSNLKEKCSESIIDFGFKVFKLSASNIKPWDAEFDSMDQDLVETVENIKPERSEDDVLYELLLKYGLDLAIPIETRDIEGQKVTVIGAGALVVCLADEITLAVVSGIAALKDELDPEIMRVVFKDSGFADDVAKTNAAQILKQAGIDDVKSL